MKPFLKGLKKRFKGLLKGVEGLRVLDGFFDFFVVCKKLSLGRVALYTVFVVLSLPINLAKKLVKSFAKKC